jgi:hypothetical protein
MNENERSLSEEITEGFKALKAMRNNKPVPCMNKVLQKIMDQSFTDEQGERFDPERFAELIVRECIGITDALVNRNVDGTWTSNELYTDYNGALFEVKRRIEEHFGVEE